MKYFLFITCFLKIVLFNSQAYEIKAEFENKFSHSEIVEGQSFDVYIKIWPFGNEDVEYVKKSLEEKTFLDFFYIAKVYNVSYSKNNEEVMEINAKAILKKSYVPRSFYLWSYKSLTIPFDLINITPIKNPNGKKFVILEQAYDPFSKEKLGNLLYFLSALFILLITGSLVVIRIRLKNKMKKKYELEKKMWSDLFKNADTRSELETIYLQKDDWLTFVGGETPPILHFLTTLNAIQFKQEWNEFEHLQVSDSFDEIRGMFESN